MGRPRNAGSCSEVPKVNLLNRGRSCSAAAISTNWWRSRPDPPSRSQSAARNVALDRLNTRLGSTQATTKPDEIVRAARYARVDTLFLGGDEHLWGDFDEVADRIVGHSQAVEGAVDLLDYAARMTLRQGGRVMLVARDALPPPGLPAAILRY